MCEFSSSARKAGLLQKKKVDLQKPCALKANTLSCHSCLWHHKRRIPFLCHQIWNNNKWSLSMLRIWTTLQKKAWVWHRSFVRYPEIEAWKSPSLMTSYQRFHDLISSWVCVDPCQQKDTNFYCLFLILVYLMGPACAAASLCGRCILCPFRPKPVTCRELQF